MKVIADNKNQYTIRFDYGEDFLAELKKFLVKNKIRGGWFLGIGAMIDPKIAYYDLDKEKYLSKKFKGKFEVLSLTGNVAWLKQSAKSGLFARSDLHRKSGLGLKNELMTHIHIILGKKNFSAVGGHLMGGKVSGTLEVYLNESNSLKRKLDENTKLSTLY